MDIGAVSGSESTIFVLFCCDVTAGIRRRRKRRSGEPFRQLVNSHFVHNKAADLLAALARRVCWTQLIRKILGQELVS